MSDVSDYVISPDLAPFIQTLCRQNGLSLACIAGRPSLGFWDECRQLRAARKRAGQPGLDCAHVYAHAHAVYGFRWSVVWSRLLFPVFAGWAHPISMGLPAAFEWKGLWPLVLLRAWQGKR